ncbi:hypothetical protein F01_570083 [Burkholderia cenocepacia]|nr:hypothetical protein F01_570083 [Burkholderia cenocepacia]
MTLSPFPILEELRNEGCYCRADMPGTHEHHTKSDYGHDGQHEMHIPGDESDANQHERNQQADKFQHWNLSLQSKGRPA